MSEAWQSGGAVVLRRRSKRLNWCAAVFAGALCAMATLSAPGAAQAQGFFDFLFGGPERRPPPPPSYPPPPPEIGRIAPAPLGQERVNENAGTTGHGVAFCVRLCDGQHFPLERMANATPAETCKAICPTSVTKVYFGSEIEGAVAGDGALFRPQYGVPLSQAPGRQLHLQRQGRVRAGHLGCEDRSHLAARRYRLDQGWADDVQWPQRSVGVHAGCPVDARPAIELRLFAAEADVGAAGRSAAGSRRRARHHRAGKPAAAKRSAQFESAPAGRPVAAFSPDVTRLGLHRGEAAA
jgi:hypothetical protein